MSLVSSGSGFGSGFGSGCGSVCGSGFWLIGLTNPPLLLWVCVPSGASLCL